MMASGICDMTGTKTQITDEMVRGYGMSAGAGIVGIAAAEDFGSAPDGFRPSDILDGCRSVIVLGVPFPEGALIDDDAEYIDIRNAVNERSNAAAKDVTKRIKDNGHKAKAVNGMGGKYVNGMQCGHISLKHAAELAGLGVIGKNYLLTNPEYGNLLWFSAVLTDAALVPDKRERYGICDDCDICVRACPSRALSDPSYFGKRECSGHCFKMVDKKWIIDCFLCRKVCPHRFGIIERARHSVRE
jgi:epoxyqueuosine reductase QueG